MSTIVDTLNHNATIYATPEDDTINAENWNDVVYGQGGNDAVRAGAGHDYVDGGPGDDVIYGGHNVDTLLGGCGDDFIDGGPGRDYLTGGPGADTFYFDRLDGAGTPNGTPGSNNLRADFVTDFSGCDGDKVTFDHFNDVTWDSEHANFLSGQGHVIAHLDGLEGTDFALAHVGQHWVGELIV
jgi:Ca2+-binding RTX toxin-like protein